MIPIETTRKLVCIEDSKYTTLGKIYEITEYSDSYGDKRLYYVDDLGITISVGWKTLDKFMTKEEFRNNQINKILE